MLAFQLGRPARHIVEDVGRQRHVGDARDGEGLAIVQAFQLRQLVEMFQDQIADLVHDAAARRRRHAAPRSIVQRIAGGAHRFVDIGGIAFGDGGQMHFGGRIDDIENLAGFA